MNKKGMNSISYLYTMISKNSIGINIVSLYYNGD